MKKLLALIVILCGYFLHAQVPSRPSPPTLYNNLSKEFPNFLTSEEASRLEQKLENFSNETSNQICVVIVDDFSGMDAASYAIKIGNEWGVGKKDKNNGIVVLVKPTKTDGGRDLFIAVGYGLEGAIPDLATKRIREEQIAPNLKSGNNYLALEGGTDVLMKLAKGEINVRDYVPHRGKHRGEGGWFKFLVIALIIVIIIYRLIRRGGGGGGYTFSRGGRHTYWGGNSSWGGGSWGGGGGSSGSSWGGFGGGSFGGGGSGGSW